MTNIRLLVFLLAIMFLFVHPAFGAGEWFYEVKDEPTTEEYIDLAQTNGEIDYELNEIRLPLVPVSNIASFSPDGSYDYAILTELGVKHFAFDGEEIIENEFLFLAYENPVGLALPPPYPNVAVADESSIHIFTMDDKENPYLSVTGLTFVMGITVIDTTGELAAIVNGEVKVYGTDGIELLQIPSLTIPSAELDNPLAIASSNGYTIAVLEQDKIKGYGFDGNEMVPFFEINDLNGASTFTYAEDKIWVVQDNQVLAYEAFTGDRTGMDVYSVTAGLNRPVAVAVRPGSNDLLIVDADVGDGENNVRYFAFAGDEMIEIEELGTIVSNLIQGDRYALSAEIMSLPQNPDGIDADRVRVRAFVRTEPETEVEWLVSSDEVDTWHNAWKISQDAAGITTVYKWITDAWVVYSTNPEHASPKYSENPNSDGNDGIFDLWVDIPEEFAGRAIRWKAILRTVNNEVTPAIYTEPDGDGNGNDMAVKWEANAAPFKPIIDDIDDGIDFGDMEDIKNIVDPDFPGLDRRAGWYYSTSPTISWTFDDPDMPFDEQSAFQFQVLRVISPGLYDEDNPLYDVYVTGEEGELSSHTIMASSDPSLPSALWAYQGYDFVVRVKVWDSFGAESEWSEVEEFKILAFDRPRIAEIVSAPAGQPSITFNSKGTHHVIQEDMIADDLAKTKTGAKVTLLLDSVGPIGSIDDVDLLLYYVIDDVVHIVADIFISEVTTLEDPEMPPGAVNKRWQVSFWTEAPISEIPSGTVIKMLSAGTDPDAGGGGATVMYIPPFADGVIVTEGTVYEDWMVVLQGSEQ